MIEYKEITEEFVTQVLEDLALKRLASKPKPFVLYTGKRGAIQFLQITDQDTIDQMEEGMYKIIF